MTSDFVLDALEQALYECSPAPHDDLVHRSDRGRQYLSLRYTERLAQADIEPSVGSIEHSYDNALAETISGLYKAELINRGPSWKTCESVELAMLHWVAWYTHPHLMQLLGSIPSAEFERNCHKQFEQQTIRV